MKQGPDDRVTRWLQMGDDAPLGTACVEMVATAAVFQGAGSPLPRYGAALFPPGLATLARPARVRTETGLLPTPEERVMVLPLPRSPRLNLTLPLSVEWRPGEVW